MAVPIAASLLAERLEEADVFADELGLKLDGLGVKLEIEFDEIEELVVSEPGSGLAIENWLEKSMSEPCVISTAYRYSVVY